MHGKKIPTVKLSLNKTEESYDFDIGLKWAKSPIGERWKIGGPPDWIQGAEDTTCEVCSKEMTFYAQLDSLNDEFIIGDCGMIYIFVCFECLNLKSFIQSY